MKVTPSNRESDVDPRKSEKSHRLPNLTLPNPREFAVYWVADPYGIMQDLVQAPGAGRQPCRIPKIGA
ncbi:hypothetical protein TWF106_002954 [Orbilia oligospora]|uniref:Uncharacterized protein n=1 Tax=Orbilia oligospora TaxID=2813651 RepID=A0A7C8U0S5_ORBOL|nr:hypothetical protein TWF788_005205 [Orbilia oligospora]KAF3225074.1 hypothetical protein TWF106_002954 [Orbilia oligospora]